jgi:beta-xylosidase
MAVATASAIHVNPVYGSYFADPFVWKHGEVYYAIGTGALEAAGQTVGKVFPVLQSSDFFQWQFASSAMVRPDPSLGDNFWAPEVAYADDRFYLYYSVGHGDKDHQLRVATSHTPQGPYRDLGKTLLGPPACPFAIDPHPFQDDDGRWYLFYARDFLDQEGGARAGTALMVARLKSMTELENPGTMVLRARCDWQRFQANRPMYGKEWDWHTLEGPFVRKHEGRYYCFYSGGRWETENYGVDYGIAEQVMGPYSDAGNENGPRVLHTVPHQVLGPGHNSIIAGPDHQTDYIVYHAWDKEMKARQMFIDKLVWTPDGPRCEGPTWGAAFGSQPKNNLMGK